MAESHKLNSGERLIVGQRLVSQNGRYVLVLQDDGNLVLIASGNHPVWKTKTDGHPGSMLILQNNGNLVVTAPEHNPVWSANSHPNHLSGQHQVIAAYFPIFGKGSRENGTGYRWWTRKNGQPILYIGDPVRNFPKLGLYGNRGEEDSQVIEFDFQAMASSGITTANIHLFGEHMEDPSGDILSQRALSLLDRIDDNAQTTGMMWTPTFESHKRKPIETAALINAIITRYGNKSLMKHDGIPVFFWYAAPPEETTDAEVLDKTANRVAHALELIRREHGNVHFVLDANDCRMGQVCQNELGEGDPSRWFLDPDNAGTGMPRISGFYNWQPLSWATTGPNRRDSAQNYVNRSRFFNLIPVLSTIPSFNADYHLDEDWHHYNHTRDVDEWKNNLDDVLSISNEMKGETRSREHRFLDRFEETLTYENEKTIESEKEQENKERFEMNRETSKTIKDDHKFSADLSVSGKLGPVVDFSSNVAYDYALSTESESKSALEYAKDIMDRSLERVNERVREERITKILKENETKNLHAFTNAMLVRVLVLACVLSHFFFPSISAAQESISFPARASDIPDDAVWTVSEFGEGANIIDFNVQRWSNGSWRESNGLENRNSFDWGVPLYAPAIGFIIACWRNFPDHLSPAMQHPRRSEMFGGGNFVFILSDQGTGITINHMQSQSIPQGLCPANDVGDPAFPSTTDKEGAWRVASYIDPADWVRVREGQFIGRVGNNGASSGPHLHMAAYPFISYTGDNGRVEIGSDEPMRFRNVWGHAYDHDSKPGQNDLYRWRGGRFIGNPACPDFIANSAPCQFKSILATPFLRRGTATAGSVRSEMDIVFNSGSRMVSATLGQSDQRLKLIVWDLVGNTTIRRRGETVNTAAKEVVLARVGNDTILAALRLTDDRLRIIAFGIGPAGNVYHGFSW